MNKNDINLNIGSGWEKYPYFLNFDRKSEWYKKSNKNTKFIIKRYPHYGINAIALYGQTKRFLKVGENKRERR